MSGGEIAVLFVCGVFAIISCVCALFMAVVGLALYALYGWQIIIFFERVLSRSLPGVGRVVSKEFIPEHERKVPNYDPEGICIERWETVPDAWKMVLEVDGKRASAAVSKKIYDFYEVGNEAIVRFSYGLLTKRLYIKKVLSDF